MIVGFTTDEQSYYFKKNAQGDIVSILDGDGVELAGYTYDAWGNITAISGDEHLAQSNPFRYRGYCQDNESGFFYLQSRYYDGVVGRFLNADKINILPVLMHLNFICNLFIYSENNFVNKTDHFGFFPLPMDKAIRALYAMMGGFYIGTLIAEKFNLNPTQKSLCILGVSGLFFVIEMLDKQAVIKLLITIAANLYLSSKGYYLSLSMFLHAIWNNGANITRAISDRIVQQIKNNSTIKNNVKGCLSYHNALGRKYFHITNQKAEFTSGDLYLSLQNITYTITGTHTGTSWYVVVTISDIYDFTDFGRALKYGISIGNIANDMGVIMQNLKWLIPYKVKVDVPMNV